MKDLTRDSITRHLLVMAVPVAFGMLTQSSYQLLSMYFVTQLGAAVTAGVNAVNNALFVVTALTQVLGVGTASLVAQAAGRRDQQDANVVFNQSLIVSAFCGVLTLLIFSMLVRWYLQWVTADAATLEAGAVYVSWVLPGYALLLPMMVLSAALRGIGIVQPTFIIYTTTLLINAVLAPVLIIGWGTGLALGVRGAGLAVSLSTVIGTLIMVLSFPRLQRFLDFDRRLMRPCAQQWRRIVNIGLPTGSEFVLTFFSSTVVYYTIRDFGAVAQAGFGIGSRVLQAVLVPALSIAFAAGPIAGQNFGANDHTRVKQTFTHAAALGTVVMVVAMVVLQWWTTEVLRIFDADPSILATAGLFLQLTSWTFIAQGLIYTCSMLFQGLGNTVPSLLSSVTRFFAFAVPALWVSMLPEFRIEQIWYIHIGSTLLQAVLSLWLLRIEFDKRLRLVKSNAR